MWTTRAIIGWLADLGITPGGTVNVRVVPGPYVPKTPDRIAVVTTIGGPGEFLEGAGDVAGFQLLIRGRQDPKSLDSTAEDDALTADRLIRFGAPPGDVTPGVRLLPVTRSGGRPVPIPNEDDGDRITFTCTYLTPVLEGADG